MILQSAACLFLSTAVHCDQLRFLWTVGSSKESRAMLLKFGVNAQAIPTVPRVALEDINEWFHNLWTVTAANKALSGKPSSDWGVGRHQELCHCSWRDVLVPDIWLVASRDKQNGDSDRRPLGPWQPWTCPDSAVQRARMWTTAPPAACPCHSA